MTPERRKNPKQRREQDRHVCAFHQAMIDMDAELVADVESGKAAHQVFVTKTQIDIDKLAEAVVQKAEIIAETLEKKADWKVITFIIGAYLVISMATFGFVYSELSANGHLLHWVKENQTLVMRSLNIKPIGK